MDDPTRRESALWTQNPSTGYYDKQPRNPPFTTSPTSPTSPTAGPYTYYQPPQPTATSSSSNRRSFAARSANLGIANPTSSGKSDAFTMAAANAAAKLGDVRRMHAAKEEALAHPAHIAMVRRMHAVSGDAGAEEFAARGHVRDTFGDEDGEGSEGGESWEGGWEGDGDEEKGLGGGVMGDENALPAASVDDRGAEDFAQVKHITDEEGGISPASAAAPGVGAIDSSTVSPISPDEQQQQPFEPIPPAAAAAATTSRSAPSSGPPPTSISTSRPTTLPAHSPLQTLERTASKEEKRARLADLENRANIARQTTLRSEKNRVVSDGSRRPAESTSDKYYQHSPRGVSAGERFYRGGGGGEAATAAAAGVGGAGIPAIATEPRPYHHAPAVPRSLDSTRAARETERDSRGYPAGYGGTPPIAKDPRPYHHAPPVPRSLDSVPKQDAREFATPMVAGAAAGAAGVAGVAGASAGEGFEGPPIAREARPYRHAPPKPTSARASMEQGRGSMDGGAFSGAGAGAEREDAGPGNLDRTTSGRYKHRLRDAGYVGAATAVAVGGGAVAYEAATRKPDEIMYDASNNKNEELGRSGSVNRSGSKKLQKKPRGTNDFDGGSMQSNEAGAYDSRQNGEAASLDRTSSINRSGSKKLQKKSGPPPGRQSMDAPYAAGAAALGGAAVAGGAAYAAESDLGKQTLQSDRMGGGLEGSGSDRKAAKYSDAGPDPVSRHSVKTGHKNPVPYNIPPQTAAGVAAREQVGFDDTQHEPVPEAEDQKRHHKLGGLLHHRQDGAGPRGYQAAKPLEEWRGVAPVALLLADLEFDRHGSVSGNTRDSAWWEKGNRASQRSSASRQMQSQPAPYDGPYEEEAKLFRPPLFLKCGPLLRYTGLRREGEREIWRGSVMIVTEDEQSDYSSSVPTLRLFAQPMDLLPPSPPKHVLDNSEQDVPPELEDPLAGQVKVSRTGRPLYVRPVHDIPAGTDLSREENNQGLYAATKTPLLGPQTSSHPDGRQSQHITYHETSRIKGRDGEKVGRYKDVRAVRLHAERGFTFWRWSLEIELGSTQHRVAYRINRGPALGFWVPARGETMNVIFHSCNGFSLNVDSNSFSGPDPLWRDVMAKHQSRPFHAMIGGGDQVYNDAAMRDTVLFKEWLQTKSPDWKHGADFTPEMQQELETFYLERYAMWFSQGLFAMAGSQIPMVNLWDDHDIIDGYGSYPHHFMSTRVFAGLGAVAFKYYMLFQHQSLVAETAKEEPSWVLGASPGPYINELSRHVFLDLGRKVKFLGVDCRTERMRDEILSQRSYDILFNKCRAEIQRGETRHLIVLLGVPIAYPRLNFLENILTSRMMDPIKAIGRMGVLGGFVNKFDGGVEILDDLDDHWTAKHHKAERNWFIQELQELAAEKSVRVTILGGDVHLGAVGQFYTPKKFHVAKDRDHRYMPNVISSAIVNTPPPTMMADVLNRRNKVHHLDSETDEDLIPMFDVDVDGSKRNNRCLLPRRNYATIREFLPGHTPPPTPPPTDERTVQFAQEDQEYRDERRYPPGSMARRTMSLTRGPANLVRRLSGSRSRESSAAAGAEMARSNSMDAPRVQNVPSQASMDNNVNEPRRPSFHRRPSDMNEKAIRKAAARGGAPDEEGADTDGREPGHIDLEGGLDISLNMEIDQQDPAGATHAYRLLVPALWYEGPGDVNTSRLKSRRGTIMERLRGRGKNVQEFHTGSREESPQPADAEDGVQQQQAQRSAVTGEPLGAHPPNNNYGADGTYNEPTRNGTGASQGLVIDQRAMAYGKGYNLSAPPIGSATQQQQQPRTTTQQMQQPAPVPSSRSTNANNNPYPSQTAYRNAAPVPQNQRGQQLSYDDGQDDDGQDEYDDAYNSEADSFTSDEYVDARDKQPRRFGLGKAERFFGIGGDKGGSGNGSQGLDGSGGMVGGGGVGRDAVAAPARKKANWKIWK